jgi:hypothetical protein
VNTTALSNGTNGRRIVPLLNLMTEKVKVSEALRLGEPNMQENVQNKSCL